jgi:hypothetical protein
MYAWQINKRRRNYITKNYTRLYVSQIIEKPAEFMDKQCMWNEYESITKIKILGVILTL